MSSRARPRFAATGPDRWPHPNRQAKNRIAYRQLEAALEHAASTYARGRLVDVGCGRKAWEPLFAVHVDEHVGVDHVPKLVDGVDRVDLIATAYDVPLPDDHADTVLLAEVLEHLEDPGRGLAECARLLKTGGHLIVTTPFFWPVHDQRDFYRYAPGGLRYLLEEAGLEVVEIVPLSGVWGTVSLQVSYALERYRRGPAAPVVDAVASGIQWLAARFDQVDFQPKFSWNHLAVARKPETVDR
jgi:SAM-dependent methyltransferase